MLLRHAVGAVVCAALATAAEPGFSPRGKMMFQENFSSPALDPKWAGKPGTWEIVDGAAKISERPEDKHAAVRRRALAYHDAIFEFSFRFDGARMIALSLNNKAGHVCRLMLTPRGMILQADQPNPKSDLKAERLATADARIAPGEWHKVVVEVRGPRMTAQLDGKQTITGQSPRVDVDKTDFGFPVSGVSALLDNVAVYEVAR